MSVQNLLIFEIDFQAVSHAMAMCKLDKRKEELDSSEEISWVEVGKSVWNYGSGSGEDVWRGDLTGVAYGGKGLAGEHVTDWDEGLVIAMFSW